MIKRPFTWFWELSRIKKIVIILILLGIGYWRYSSVKNAGITPEVTTAHKGELTESISASGEVSALEVANLSFQTAGKLSYVGVQEGDSVKKGKLIAALDTTILREQLKKYLNTFNKQRTTFDDTSDAADDVTLNDAVARIKTRAQVDLDQTVIDVEIQNEALRLSNLNSPIAGIVTKATPGSSGINVGPTTASYQIVNPDTVYFSANVNEVDIPRLNSNTPVEIELTAFPDEVLHESIQSIGFSSVITSSGGTAYKVVISLPDNSAMKYRLGMNGDVKFILDTKENVLLVPGTSVVESYGKSYIWIVTSDNRAHKQEVTTGSSSIEETEIIEGLSDGEKIIDRPNKEVVEGVKIKEAIGTRQ
jgi:macrolide-specific efflux system membrane fusion protein